MQSFISKYASRLPRKRYVLKRGLVLYINDILTEQLRPRKNAYVVTMSPDTYGTPVGPVITKGTRMVFCKQHTHAHQQHFGSSSFHCEHEEVHHFCTCGTHTWRHFSFLNPAYQIPNIKLSCPSCGNKDFLDGNSHSAPHFTESPRQKRLTYTVHHFVFDHLCMYDDRHKGGPISLKMLSHSTFFDRMSGRLGSNDVHQKIIFSPKTQRMYYYKNRSIKDITHVVMDEFRSLWVSGRLDNEFRRLFPDHPECGPLKWNKPKKAAPYSPITLQKNEDLYAVASRHFFGEFCRLVYDIAEKPAWAPAYDEQFPVESLQRLMYAMHSPNSLTLFKDYTLGNEDSFEFTKALRHFKKESQAMDFLINAPSGHLRRLLGTTENHVERELILNSAMYFSDCFEDHNHYNTLLTHVLERWRHYESKQFDYYLREDNIEDYINKMTPSSVKYDATLEKPLTDYFATDVGYSSVTSFLSPIISFKDGSSHRFIPNVFISVKNNRPFREASSFSKVFREFLSLTGVTESRGNDMLKFMVDHALSDGGAHMFNTFYSAVNDYNRMLHTIHRRVPGYRPNVGLNLFEEEARLTKVAHRVGINHYLFNYTDKQRRYEGEFGGHTFRLPRSSTELSNIGKVLSHCVGGYHSFVASGECTIVLVERGDDYVLAIEVNEAGTVVQVKGKNNNSGYHIPKPLQDIVLQWVKSNELGISTRDLLTDGPSPVPYLPADYVEIEMKCDYDQASLDEIYEGRVTPRPPVERLTFEEACERFESYRIRYQEKLAEIEKQTQQLIGPAINNDLLRVSEPEPFDGNVRNPFRGHGPNLTEDDLPF